MKRTLPLLLLTALAAVCYPMLEDAQVTKPGPQLAGRGSTPTPANVPSTRAPAENGAHFRAGDQYRYRMSLDSELTLGDGEAASAGFELRAVWSLSARARAGGGVRLLAELEQPHFQLLEVGDGVERAARQAEEERIAGAFAAPHALDLDTHGSLQGVALPEGLEPQVESTLRALAALFQYVQPPAATPRWRSHERDPNGAYEALYERLNATRTEKHKLGYRASGDEGEDGVRSEVVTSGASFELDPDGAITSVTLDETLRVRADRNFTGGHSRTRLKLKLVSRTAADPPAHLATLAALPARPVDAPLSARSRRSMLDQAKIAGSELTAVLDTIADPKRDSKARYRAMFALEALLRQDPGGIERALARIRQGDDRDGVMLGALGQAATPEAQAALLSLLRNPGPNGPQPIQSLLALRHADPPSPQTLALHRELFDDPGLGSQARLGLGSLSRHLRDAGDDTRAAQGAALLEAELRAATTPSDIRTALRALANAGHEGSLPALAPYLEHDDPELRALAAAALAHMQGGESLSAAIGLTQDGRVMVREAAVRVLGKRIGDAQAVAVLADVARSDDNTRVRYLALEAVVEDRAARVTLQKDLAWVAAHDADAKNRSLAEQALDG